MKWNTRVPNEELEPNNKTHYALFLPKKWQGEGLFVNLLLPECELQADRPTPPGAEPEVFINRPPPEVQKVENWLPLACKIATKQAAALFFTCDTAEQAEQAARMASLLLPDHERVELESMYMDEADTSASGSVH
jgi:hypothetical protein